MLQQQPRTNLGKTPHLLPIRLLYRFERLSFPLHRIEKQALALVGFLVRIVLNLRDESELKPNLTITRQFH